MQITNPHLKKLVNLYKELSLLSQVRSILEWDLNVNLPPKAAKGRAEQNTYIANLITEKWLNPEFRTLLEQLTKDKSLNDDEKAMVRNLNYAAKFYHKVPKKVILQKETVTSEAFLVWKQAREENKFKLFLPYLEKIIDLNQQIAGHLGYKKNPYDALLDLFEPELTADETEQLFSQLRNEIVLLLNKIKKSKKFKQPLPFLENNTRYPKEEQEKLAKYLTQLMGYDMQAGRIDVSPHPFTITLNRYDVRVTTAYKETDFREGITASIHEAGHALYEQNVNTQYDGTPLEHGVSLGIHEAQSRFWENMVGKNPNFLKHISPLLKSHYPALNTVNDELLALAFNYVTPSFIRIEADEITYSLHIILRFEMENALINGKIKPKDAAEMWRAKSKKYFGVEPKTDAEGVLQDVHWTYGAFGYFPAYAIGNLYGAQFLDTMKKKVKFEEELEKGNLLPIKQWFDEHVHQHGSRYFPKELVKKVTGKPLDYRYFVHYLNEKYSVLY